MNQINNQVISNEALENSVKSRAVMREIHEEQYKKELLKQEQEQHGQSGYNTGSDDVHKETLDKAEKKKELEKKALKAELSQMIKQMKIDYFYKRVSPTYNKGDISEDIIDILRLKYCETIDADDVDFILKMRRINPWTINEDVDSYISKHIKEPKDIDISNVIRIKQLVDYLVYIKIMDKEVRRMIRRNHEKIIEYTESIGLGTGGSLDEAGKIKALIKSDKLSKELIHELLSVYFVLFKYLEDIKLVSEDPDKKHERIQQIVSNVKNIITNIVNYKYYSASVNSFIAIYLIITAIMVIVLNVGPLKKKLQKLNAVGLLNIQFGTTALLALLYIVCMIYRNKRIGLISFKESYNDLFEKFTKHINNCLSDEKDLGVENESIKGDSGAMHLPTGDLNDIISAIKINIAKTDVINAITGKSKTDELENSGNKESPRVSDITIDSADIFLPQIVITNKIAVTAIYSGISILVMLIVGFIKKISIKHLAVILLISIVASVIQYIIALVIQSTGLVKFKGYMDY